MRKTLVVISCIALAVTIILFSTKFEMPGPRHSQPNDYPSLVAVDLKQAIHADSNLNRGDLRVLWCWDWRWRYGADIQVWGIENPSQQEAIIRHLESIKSNLGTGRFIHVEFLSGPPDRPPFGKSLNKVLIKTQSHN